jgi:hypothetical protein
VVVDRGAIAKGPSRLSSVAAFCFGRRCISLPLRLLAKESAEGGLLEFPIDPIFAGEKRRLCLTELSPFFVRVLAQLAKINVLPEQNLALCSV